MVIDNTNENVISVAWFSFSAEVNARRLSREYVFWSLAKVFSKVGYLTSL